MKKTKIVVEFEKEKLDVLQFYLGKKKEKLEDELSQTIEKLYEKHVPSTTREYVESRLETEIQAVKTRDNQAVKNAVKPEREEPNKPTVF